MPKRPKNEEIEKKADSRNAELFAVSRLAILCGIDRRQAEKRLAEVTPAKIDGRVRYFRLEGALPALCHETEGAEGERRMAALKEREAITRADLADIEIAERIGELVSAKQSELDWEDRGRAVRAIIEASDYLKPTQKTKLIQEIAALKFREEE